MALSEGRNLGMNSVSTAKTVDIDVPVLIVGGGGAGLTYVLDARKP